MKIQNYYKNYRKIQGRQIHVAYHFNSKDGKSGFGRMSLTLCNRFSVTEVEDFIRRNKDFASVVVISWQPENFI